MGSGGVGVPVRLIDGNGHDLGLAHLPHPVEAGDFAALEHGFPFRLIGVFELEWAGTVDVVAEVEAAPSCLAR